MRIKDLFLKPSYKLAIHRDRVYRKWNRSITDWSESEQDSYMAELRSLVEKTVSSETWNLLTSESRTSNPIYCEYVEKVKDNLIKEFNLEDEQESVKIGLYHSDMLVISFPTSKLDDIPYYFQGIQIKPHLKTDSEPVE
jgi:hypothetical protein